MPRHDVHSEWLSLIEVSGPFLTVPVLDRVFPQGLDDLESDVAGRIRLAYDEWAEDQSGLRPDPRIHDQWLRFVLETVLEFPAETLAFDTGSRFAADIPEHDETVRPEAVVLDPANGRARLLVSLWSNTQLLDSQPPDDKWAATPIERMTTLCRALAVDGKVPLGLVTNGRQWTLVHAPAGETVGHASWYAPLWSEEPLTLRAFRSLLGVRRFFAVPDDETIEALLADSANYQDEVTSQLGSQVRRAVEVLVQAFDRADLDSGRTLLPEVPIGQLYEAAVTVMMRLVFLFSAEERDMLLLGDPLYDANYAVSPLGAQLRVEADRVGIEVLEHRQDAWSRLCATFRAVFGGVEHDRLRLIAYGGSLFDPDRFPFLEGRQPGTDWRDTGAQPLPIDNRTVLHLLEALQLLRVAGREPQRLSFRALDVEQIGHVYEGLLDHTAIRIDEPYFGLTGTRDHEPELPLSRLESAQNEDALVKLLSEATGRSASAIRRGLKQEMDAAVANRLAVSCGHDDALIARVAPFAGLLRSDVWGFPAVYPADSLLVTAGLDRRSTQTFYTPRALAEEVVQYALEPLAYMGPAEGKPRDEWELRPVAELLDLKICDPTMGSGAFLVATCRWLGARVAEAWDAAGANESPIVAASGSPATGAFGELLVPRNADERASLARRLVAERCLYGVDVNPFAVEMAKLSVWLVTLAKERPFGFLDHALKCGDSLLGVTSLDQVCYMHLDPERGKIVNKGLWFDFEADVLPIIEHALGLRASLEAFPVIEPSDALRKSKLLGEAEGALRTAQVLANAVVAAAIGEAGGTGTYDHLLARYQADRVVGAAMLADWLNIDLPLGRPARRTFHWPLEFPEVFGRERPGFDAIVANPPFLLGKRITGTLGTAYRSYLVKWILAGTRGNADLSAFFLRRFSALTRQSGAVGMLATNSIAQGETRYVGLAALLDSGHDAYRAVSSRPWPGTAAVAIAQVWLIRGSWPAKCVLDGIVVDAIDSGLRPARSISRETYQLRENSGIAFVGSYVLGDGFVLTPPEAEDFLRADFRRKAVLFPYVNGDDISQRPDQSASRWVIDFGDRSLEEAQAFGDVFARVEALVKPVRATKARKAHREYWWLHAEFRPGLRSAIASLHTVFVKARTSSTWAWVAVPAQQVFADAVVVVASEDWSLFATLQSAVHREWMWLLTPTLETRDTYPPGPTFGTFPKPTEQELTTAGLAEQFHRLRSEVCIRRGEGLTTIANRIDDPAETSSDIEELRHAQAEIDRVTVQAYGWSDLAVRHCYRDVRGKRRFALDPDLAIEILDRLLRLNHERYAAETAPSGVSRADPSGADSGDVLRATGATQ